MALVVPGEETMAQRLLTDKRMKTVWRTLKHAKVTSEEIPHPLSGPLPPSLQVANLDKFERLETWDIPSWDFSLQDQACAALFAYVVVEFSNTRPSGTRSDAEALAAPFLSAAKTCRQIVNEAPFPTAEEKRAIEVAAAYVEKWVRWQLKHLLDSPYIIGERSSGDDKIRAQVGALATATHRIFGSFLYRTVATVATVALQPKTDLSVRTVRNWCAALPLKKPA